MSGGRVLHCFVNANLSMSHPGLSTLAKKYKIFAEKLQPGEFLVFINSRRDKMKVYGSHQVLSYIRVDHGHIDLNTIRYIPAAFNAKGKIDYDEALRIRLVAALKEKGSVDNLQVFTSAAVRE